MSHTLRHLVAATVWLALVPATAIAFFAVEWFPPEQMALIAVIVSLVWVVGLIGIFALWTLKDAPAHGKSRDAAMAFVAASLLFHFLAVFPYLFYTRGRKAGFLSSLQFACFCLAVAVAWVGVPWLFRTFA
jgi:hypothetical protein